MLSLPALLLAAGHICSYKTLHGIGVFKLNDCLGANENNGLLQLE